MSGTYDDSISLDVSSDSFWEVGNYKRAVRRVDDGNRLCTDLMTCLHERARIEKAYAQQLTEWARRWRQLIERGPQYGSVERAWSALCTEAEKVSELHVEVKSQLMGEDYEQLKIWQRDAYHKQMIGGFKETREADDGFRKAQKPWAKKLKEVDLMKKAYHAACKEEKLATSREASGRIESGNNPDVQKKLQEKVERCQQDVQKARERYEKSLEDLDKTTPQYMENMEQVFEQWQQFEEKRLCFFKDLLLDVKKHLDLSTNHRFQTIYQTLEDSITSSDPNEDLKWFRTNHGPGMAMCWPQFEDWSVDLNRTLSRRETKKKPDGVTLTGISQTASEPPDHAPRTSSRLAVPSKAAPVGTNPFEDEEEEEEPVEEQRTACHIVLNKEDVKITETNPASPNRAEDGTANPFSSNGEGNPFEDEPASPAVSVAVRALYDYEGQEQDELSFRAGEEFTKIGEEDEQGWCRGLLKNGKTGLYPANYVEDVQ